MKFESRYARRERRIRSWHVKYAWWPKTIGTTTVWLDDYWARFVDVKIDSRHALEFAFTCAFLGVRCGHWEWSVTEPIVPDNVIKLRSAS